MLTTVEAVEFTKPMGSGKTLPSLVLCEKADGTTVELVAKFSGGCDAREASLTREVIAACLAADLKLPIPTPYLVDIPTGWESVVPDTGRQAQIAASCRTAFGSTFVTGQFTLVTPGTVISDEMLGIAAAIFVFDALAQNADRRASNPNCLIRGTEFRIFDHELTFPSMLLGFVPPWTVGGLKSLENNENHVFRKQMLGRKIDFHPVKSAWQDLSDHRIDQYGQSVPAAWLASKVVADNDVVAKSLATIKAARDHIDACLTEVERVLK